MKRLAIATWSAVPFASAAAFVVAAHAVYWPLHGAAMLACTSSTTLVTTDLSSTDHASYSEWCTAPWYRYAEGSAFVLGVVAAASVAGLVACKLATTHKRITGVSIFLLALVAIAAQF